MDVPEPSPSPKRNKYENVGNGMAYSPADYRPVPGPAAPPPRMGEGMPPKESPSHEPAARKMDVDENYDDEEEEKRPAVSGTPSKRESPRQDVVMADGDGPGDK